ncbi:hypothetical protein FNV43_RR11058 [Rhamnella rubrinervis]|uniref:Uncharacterized protein n=1 Tax=Rhamnella rubrinervis TaxID=2594499 RepID=A0A8K0MHA2_9ROSA|nr:hypothetical protein FNV43_RR11058 [Rhamnella rubrinervis]
MADKSYKNLLEKVATYFSCETFFGEGNSTQPTMTVERMKKKLGEIKKNEAGEKRGNNGSEGSQYIGGFLFLYLCVCSSRAAIFRQVYGTEAIGYHGSVAFGGHWPEDKLLRLEGRIKELEADTIESKEVNKKKVNTAKANAEDTSVRGTSGIKGDNVGDTIVE